MKKQVSVLVVIGVVLALAGAVRADLMDGLVAFYAFEDPANLGFDRTGNGNDGTAFGDPTAVVGKVGGGVEFDGGLNGTSGDYFVLANEANFDLVDGMTVAVWVKTTWDKTWQAIVAKGEGDRWKERHIGRSNQELSGQDNDRHARRKEDRRGDTEHFWLTHPRADQYRQPAGDHGEQNQPDVDHWIEAHVP